MAKNKQQKKKEQKRKKEREQRAAELKAAKKRAREQTSGTSARLTAGTSKPSFLAGNTRRPFNHRNDD